MLQVFLCIVYLWRFNLKIASAPTSRQLLLGAGCGYHLMRYPIWIPNAITISSALPCRLPFVKMTIQLCSYSARERFGGGLVQLVDPQQPALPTFCCAKKCPSNQLVTNCFRKAFDRSLLSSWACSEKLKYIIHMRTCY